MSGLLLPVFQLAFGGVTLQIRLLLDSNISIFFIFSVHSFSCILDKVLHDRQYSYTNCEQRLL